MPKKTKKQKSLFDHVNAITKEKNPNYWETLSEEDKKTFSVYMIQRYLSMNPNWLDIIAELQPYTQDLSPEMFYKVYSQILPKYNGFLKYVGGGKKSSKYEDWVLDIVRNHYEVSSKEALDYLSIFYSTNDGKSSLHSLLEKYGVEPKKLKKLKLKS